MNYFLDAIKKYADFSGRARRKEYWMFYLMYIVLFIVVNIIDSMIGAPLFTLVFVFGLFVPSLAVLVRRLHDTGRSGWMMLISLIPLVGGFIVLYFLVQDSQEENKFGPNPKTVK